MRVARLVRTFGEPGKIYNATNLHMYTPDRPVPFSRCLSCTVLGQQAREYVEANPALAVASVPTSPSSGSSPCCSAIRLGSRRC